MWWRVARRTQGWCTVAGDQEQADAFLSGGFRPNHLIRQTWIDML
jgi:hypothetical protein